MMIRALNLLLLIFFLFLCRFPVKSDSEFGTDKSILEDSDLDVVIFFFLRNKFVFKKIRICKNLLLLLSFVFSSRNWLQNMDIRSKRTPRQPKMVIY